MKSVKSIADLKQLALAKGATVEVGSTRYNTTNERVRAFPKKAEAEPAPVEVKPEPVAAPEVRLDLAPMAAMQERVGEMLASAIAAMPRSAPPVREWLFTVERDESGLLTAIKATAKE